MVKRFAEIDGNNIVKRVIVADSKKWCEDSLGGTWIETEKYSKDKNYAGIGHTYDDKLSSFIAPKPFASWVLDEKCKWTSPAPMPKDGKNYFWSEKDLTYKEISNLSEVASWQ